MRTIASLGLVVISSVFLSCKDDVDSVQPVPPAPPKVPTADKTVADFVSKGITVPETNPDPIEVKIKLSPPVTVASRITIQALSGTMDQFITNPPLLNGQLILNAAVGDSVLRFTVKPLNDNIITGHSSMTFSIASVDGSIVKGTELDQVLTVQDDELAQKVRGYETTGSGDVVKRFYEYDSKGRIAKVNWETSTLASKRSGTHTWFYDENDRLIKINKYPGRDVHYSWDSGKIWKEDVYQDGTLIQYTIYAYDAKGNVAGVNPYYKQADGSFRIGLFSVFLYFNDGNIYKSLTYSGEENPVLVSTRTYDNYINVDNPFPMVEILPNVQSQTKLATTYRVEESGFDFEYTVTYTMRDDGLPATRTTAGGVGETTVYHYY